MTNSGHAESSTDTRRVRWRRRKLITLLLLATLVGLFTYPTWQDLVIPSPKVVRWSDSDALGMIINPKEVQSAYLSIDGYMDTATETGGKPNYTTGLYLRNQLLPSVASSVIYFVAQGRAASLMDQCLGHVSETGIEYKSVDGFLKLSQDRAQTLGLTQHTLDIVPNEQASYYSEQISAEPPATTSTDKPDCFVDATLFWSQRGGRASWNAPWVYADVVKDRSLPVDEVLPGTGEYPTERSDADICVRSTVSWGPGATPGDPTPTAAKTSQNTNRKLEGAGYDWPSCESFGNYEGNGYGLLQAPTSIGIVDDVATDDTNQNIFFAGAFAGILSGLAIEIVNGVLDLSESTAERRRRRHDEDLTPTPDPEPVPPPQDDPDTEQDELDQPPPWNPNDSSYM